MTARQYKCYAVMSEEDWDAANEEGPTVAAVLSGALGAMSLGDAAALPPKKITYNRSPSAELDSLWGYPKLTPLPPPRTEKSWLDAEPGEDEPTRAKRRSKEEVQYTKRARLRARNFMMTQLEYACKPRHPYMHVANLALHQIEGLKNVWTVVARIRLQSACGGYERSITVKFDSRTDDIVGLQAELPDVKKALMALPPVLSHDKEMRIAEHAVRVAAAELHA